MCGIFCSKSKDKFIELSHLNSYRGNHSFSICGFSDEGPFKIKHDFTRTQLGKFDFGVVPPNASDYYVGHVQAPTTQSRSIDNVHPAVYGDDMLWHNGIIKHSDVKRLQQKHNTSETWDTMLLLREIHDNSCRGLSDVDGGFACILYKHSDNLLYTFTNSICSLFVDNDLNISSVKFDGSYILEPEVIHAIDLDSNSITSLDVKFKTKNSPYFFFEE